MTDFKKIHNVFLIGIGGIGMSALARYFHLDGKYVAGYDLTKSPLTLKLAEEGIDIHYLDEISLIPEVIRNDKESMIIYTPAIPNDNKELNYFQNSQYQIFKRSQILGLLTSNKNTVAVAGTHGKTSISGLLSHILTSSGDLCTAFLGGISKNYNSNFYFSENAKYIVTEADEFDRSFHNLNPSHAIITSTDADHLDIYKDHSSLIKSFSEFAGKVKEKGFLLLKEGISIDSNFTNKSKVYTYSTTNKADFTIKNNHYTFGKSTFDILLPDYTSIDGISISLPGLINIENALASASMAWLLGISKEDIKTSLGTFNGIIRRFDFKILTKDLIFMDDYAHHPNEISAMISSVKEMFPDKKITGIFQPHLFSRTKDFAKEFAQVYNA